MTAATWITMVSIMTYIWGGCALAVLTAIRKEGNKVQGPVEELGRAALRAPRGQIPGGAPKA
jgi:hypothetical protein